MGGDLDANAKTSFLRTGKELGSGLDNYADFVSCDVFALVFVCFWTVFPAQTTERNVASHGLLAPKSPSINGCHAVTGMKPPLYQKCLEMQGT